ncbi:hypothetical protein [Alteromonas lipolytica]|uniref:Uncharacterized protein n=1 Tax=Alteromonas lipolytica TaxID=1856405 RepID=A0A1E8FBL9_9ALTE|nr:hypothetical protein [Alteromonas lipolytica]OFI33176.1 hypothetical protein BFC17_02640 [Alteromonas lipolytica]GGF61851.1 hypothetical protein GCM10011338_12770 [Alteromonas lipolytica]
MNPIITVILTIAVLLVSWSAKMTLDEFDHKTLLAAALCFLYLSNLYRLIKNPTRKIELALSGTGGLIALLFLIII